MSARVSKLLARNRRWAERTEAVDPGFFRRLEHQQRPRILWIGCSDSRVPATQITDMAPGEMFVHRNVANVVSAADGNALAVIEFAIESLEVADVIVCGHYGCGGIQAVLDDRKTGRLGEWLVPVATVRDRHARELEKLGARRRRFDRLCELNVEAQVESLSELDAIRGAWRAGRELTIHGWIYRVGDGRLRDLGVGRSAPPD